MAFAAILPYVAAGITALSAIRQGQAAKAAADYNATLDRQNASVAREETAALAAKQDRENFLRLGAIHAAQGKSGGQAGAGSVLDIISDAASQGELQKQYIQRAGYIKATGYENSATLNQARGKNAMKGAYLQAAAALIGMGASAYTGGAGTTMTQGYTSTGGYASSADTVYSP